MEKEVRVSTAAAITQLFSLTCDPSKGLLPTSMGSMFPAIVILSWFHLDRALLHKRPGLSSEPEVIEGHRGPTAGGGGGGNLGSVYHKKTQ